MKPLFKILVFAAIIAATVLYWPKISALWAPAPAPTKAKAPAPAPTPVPQPPNLSPRQWTNLDKRNFEGALIAADTQSAIIRRTSDSRLFKISLTTLSASDQSFTREQVNRAEKLGLKLSASLHMISRKLTIKGWLEKIPASEAEGGYRIFRVDPTYWLLLARPLNDGQQGAQWVRVDEKTFRLSPENTLISNEYLSNFSDNKGGFSESLPWPRPEFTIIEASYGTNHNSPTFGSSALENPNAGPANVTLQLMRYVSSGKLPMQIGPGVFFSQGNELSVLWRTPSGEIRQSLRDGSIFTWP